MTDPCSTLQALRDASRDLAAALDRYEAWMACGEPGLVVEAARDAEIASATLAGAVCDLRGARRAEVHERRAG